jgi:hypothetical protein
MADDLAAWEELWHATKDVVIVGHKPGTQACPYRVGHSLREHCLHIAPQVEAKFQALIAANRHIETSQEGKAG